MEGTAATFEAFLATGTTYLNWLVSSALKLVTDLMANPVTSVMLISGLIGAVFVTFKLVTRR